jgi:CDP-diacylglycerol--glycerol-3-phosphate 3-phosphatidyltransferase
MNLPNKLSLLRVLLIPFMIFFYFHPHLFGVDEFGYYALPLIFMVASFTDYVDGYLARKHNLVTTFGKFIDPLADKLLVMTALILLNAHGSLGYWITIVILAREFIVTGIRLVAMSEGEVVAASNLGKYKTASTMLGLFLMLLFVFGDIFSQVGLYIVYVGVLLTVVSGIDYYVKNKDYITKSI